MPLKENKRSLKRRPKQNVSEVVNLIGEVKGRNVILFDDICDTAGTLTAAARHLADAGANEIYAGCTHAILSKDAMAKIMDAPITELVVTDTLHLPEEKRTDKIKRLSVAEIFGKAIMRIHNEESISSLFEEVI